MGQSSARGSAVCTVCAADYYRETAEADAATCRSCDEYSGVTCGWNATVASVALRPGYWRHSALTMEVWRCEHSLCAGGAHAGMDGDGYCASSDHTGLRCEQYPDGSL